jgi:hypothetical protein
MTILRIAVGFTFGVLLASLGHCQSIDIRIDNNYWNAFQPQVKDALRIQGKDGKYTANGKSIDPSTIQEFVRSLDEPLLKEISLENLGLTQDWLNANAEAAFLERFKDGITDISSTQKTLFEDKFRNLNFMQHVVQTYYSSIWTDDYPKLSLSIRLGARAVQLTSAEQHQFMIPWTIVENGETKESFNANISRAIAAMLPANAMHKSRLAGKNLRYALSEKLLWALRDEWAILTTEAKMPNDIQKVRENYRVEKSDVGCIASIDVDGACPSWNAKLRSTALPSNYAIGVSLPYENGHLPGLAFFEERIPGYSQLAASVPWFRQYLEHHPGAEAQIRFVVDRSLSKRATCKLLEDLRKHDKDALAKRIEKETGESVFVEVSEEKHNWSRWVIFPNGDMLLWHFQGDSALDFPATKFVSWEYYSWRSTGALIRPDGTVEQ